MSKRVRAGAVRTKDDIITENQEKVRIAVLSVTNSSNDQLITTGLQHIQQFSQNVGVRQDLAKTSLATLSMTHLKELNRIAQMNNTDAAMAAFAKMVFAADYDAAMSKMKELDYMKKAQVAVATYATEVEYFDNKKTDMPRFRNDVEDAMLNLANAAGAAAAAGGAQE